MPEQVAFVGCVAVALLYAISCCLNPYDAPLFNFTPMLFAFSMGMPWFRAYRKLKLKRETESYEY